MKEFSTPFKLDKRNLWYIDSNDVKLEQKVFSEIGKKYHNRNHFYLIDGVDDYIIKDESKYTKMFRKTRIINMLKVFVSVQEKLSNIGFPVGYFVNYGKVDGTIIPYYKDSISVDEFICFQKFEELKKYYNKSSDDIDNLVCLLTDILKIISDMYDNNISYLDIHPGNFLLYNNEVKIIDFEPNYLYLKKKNSNTHDRMLLNYALTVCEICRRLKFENVFFNSGESFIETEERIRGFCKRLER